MNMGTIYLSHFTDEDKLRKAKKFKQGQKASKCLRMNHIVIHTHTHTLYMAVYTHAYTCMLTHMFMCLYTFFN